MLTFLLDRAAPALSSDIFAGGLALGLIGAGLGLLHAFWGRLRGWLSRRLLASVTVDSRSSAHGAIYAWLAATGALARVRHVRVTEAGGAAIYGPEPGDWWFRRGGRLCRFRREVDEKARAMAHRGAVFETVTLTLVGGGLPVLKGWIAEGEALVAARGRAGPHLHVLRGDWWQDVGPLKLRPLDSVVCDDDRLQRLAADLAHFLGAEGWYAERGIPWRRGYLLGGPPGTGKSSAIRAVAGHLGLDVATLDLGRSTLTDDSLREAFLDAPKRAILALEDIDAAFRERVAGEARGISFSGLLNAIDGVAAQEGRAVFLTTNHIDRLDPALIRPGRVDLRVELAEVGAEAAAALFRRFFPGDAALAAGFAVRLGSRRFTPAVLQGWLLAHAGDPEAAARAEGLLAPALVLAAE